MGELATGDIDIGDRSAGEGRGQSAPPPPSAAAPSSILGLGERCGDEGPDPGPGECL
jgi:hypothetical protein